MMLPGLKITWNAAYDPRFSKLSSHDRMDAVVRHPGGRATQEQCRGVT